MRSSAPGTEPGASGPLIDATLDFVRTWFASGDRGRHRKGQPERRRRPRGRSTLSQRSRRGRTRVHRCRRTRREPSQSQTAAGFAPLRLRARHPRSSSLAAAALSVRPVLRRRRRRDRPLEDPAHPSRPTRGDRTAQAVTSGRGQAPFGAPAFDAILRCDMRAQRRTCLVRVPEEADSAVRTSWRRATTDRCPMITHVTWSAAAGRTDRADRHRRKDGRGWRDGRDHGLWLPNSLEADAGSDPSRSRPLDGRM